MGHMRRIVDNGFLGIMSSPGMAEIRGPSLQVYVGCVTKADIGQMNVGQWKIDKATRYH